MNEAQLKLYGLCGIRYTVSVGRDMRVVTKEKMFDSEKERDKFVDKLVKKDNFIELLAWTR